MAPLRVFHLIKGLGRGGAETLLIDGPRSSDAAKFEYGFGYFLPYKNALVPELQAEVGPVTEFCARTPGQMLRQVPRIARHLTSWRADVLHCHLPLAGAVGRLAGSLSRVPVVYTEHNSLERYHPLTRAAARATWRLQRQVIAVSGDVASSIERHLGNSVPVRVIRNGISPERFHATPALRAEGRALLGMSAEQLAIGSVAVFRKQKRLDLWLDAAAALAPRLPELVFVLVGDGPLRAEVEAGIRARGLQSRVRLPGLKAEVRPYLAALDCYLMSSDFEGVPLALLEAMAMELPSVVTAAGGIPEVVIDGSAGYVVPRGATEQLVARLQDLLASPERRARFGHAARQRIIERFSTARMMREVEEVYQRAVSP